tara:strand:- start:119 stop:310 length:192 start_codon:yes stop_codon:yes gene_type:complete
MKQSEVTNLSNDELLEKLSEMRKAFSDLKMSHAISPLENPVQLRNLRRNIARLATETTKRNNK